MYAIQVLVPSPVGKRRALARWKTLHVAKRRAVAERILASVRQNRLHVAEVTRLRPYNGDISRAYHLAATVEG